MISYQETALWLSRQLPQKPRIAIILGTGLGGMAENFEEIIKIPYAQIHGFVTSTAPSHKGNMILARVQDEPVLFLQGRFHYYEGYDMSQVVFPTRVLAAMGIQILIVANAAGSLRKELTPGAIVQLTDHINFMGINPLRGENCADLGERFPSMNEPFDPELREMCNLIAKEMNITTHQGVYLAVSGPSLETKAECAAFANWGADLVGMSTVPEVIAARHGGMKVLGYSIVTNYSNLFHSEAHSQDEIQRYAAEAGKNLQNLLAEFICKATQQFLLT